MKDAIVVELGKWIVTIVVVATSPLWFLPYLAIRGLYAMLTTMRDRIWYR